MIVQFYKYQGTGNDFILIDDRSENIDLNKDHISKLCSRKYGIGSDGIIIIREKLGYDFEMIFHNPDGSQSFCGNGSRCAVLFAYHIGIITRKTKFLSTDGEHEAIVKDGSIVELKMNDPTVFSHKGNQTFFINTGSPHHVEFRDEIDSLDFLNESKKIRFNNEYASDGVNVNFVEKNAVGIKMRTYERGVEDETLSCGTGVTAAALAFANHESNDCNEVEVLTAGGNLKVRYTKSNKSFSDIWLIGPAQYVFKGDMDVS